jgi:hypothetical protein
VSDPDLLIADVGLMTCVFCLFPLSAAGWEWIERKVAYEPGQSPADGIAVEPQYVDDLVNGAVADGLVLKSGTGKALH